MSFQCKNNLRFKVIFLCLILFSHIQRNAFAHGKICGEALTETLAEFCVDGFNNRFKRCLVQQNIEVITSPPAESLYHHLKDILGKVKPKLSDSNPEIFEIGHPKIKSDKLLTRKRKHINYVTSGGVADECCSEGCVYADIIKYCA